MTRIIQFALAMAALTLTTGVQAQTVSIAVNPTSLLEDGTPNFTYTVTRSPISATPTTVNITTTGTATSSVDYTGGVLNVVIPANSATATITLNPTADTILEPDETVILTVSPGSYTVGSPSSATGTIQNDENPCVGISFPYTLAGANNLARVANLRAAIECANVNGASADVINLNNQDVALEANNIYAIYANPTGLPRVSSPITIRNGTIRHDTSAGGFLFRTFDIASTGTLNLRAVTLQGDSAPTPGGAFLNAGTVNVLNSSISGYDTSNRAGVLSNGTGASASFVNSVVFNNNAVFAHAIDNAGTVSIINSTFNKHTSISNFGEVLSGSGYTIRNSIIWNPGTGPTQIAAGNTVSNSIVRGGYSGGTGILNTSPLFVNETTNDFRLQATSPAINIGDNAVMPADSFDLDGDSNTSEPTPDRDLNPRIIATVIDAGAYERQDALPPSAPQLTMTKTASGTSFAVGTPASFTLQLSNTGIAATTAASTITDTIPAGLTIGTLPAGCSAAAQTVTCTVAAGLAASASTSFVIPVTATVAAVPSVTNTASVSGGGDATCPAATRCSSSVTVSVTDPCAGFTFPYTLGGIDNTARAANLRSAIQCANLNGTTDVIDMNGLTVTLSDSVGDFSGATGLPQVTTALTVRNGAINRSGPAEFRFFNASNSGNLTLRNLTLTNGGGATYASDGGSVMSQGTSSVLNVVNTIISGSRNDNLRNASAVYSNATLTVVNSLINGGGSGRGAIFAVNGPVLIQNTLIAGNSASNTVNSAGGVYLGNTSSATIINSTIVGNYTGATGATRSGGIVAETGSINLTVRNSIVWGNRNSGNTAPQIVNLSGGTTTVSNSLIEGGFAGGSNIVNSDPLFLTPLIGSPTPSISGNFQLGATSPAIDAGANANVPADTFDVDGDSNTSEDAPDLAGNPRRYNDIGVVDTGTGTAPIVDMGAYERQTDSPLLADLSITKTDGQTTAIPGTAITYTIVASNAGPVSVASATVADTFPANITGVTWTCTGAGGGSCPASGSGNINATVGLPVSGSVTFTATGTISASATGTLSNTATVNSAVTDPTPGNNSATDTNTLATLPQLSISDFSTSEGNSGSTQFNFTVSLSSPALAGGVSFDIATANGTATAGSDYMARSLTGQSIAAGSSSYSFAVQVSGDVIQEPNETFFVNVTNVTGASVLDGQGQGVIQNDDTAGITVNPTTGLVTTEAGGTATFTVVLNTQPTADVSIGLSSSDTTEGTVSPISLTFTTANWNTPRTVTVTGVDDPVDDGNVGYTIVTAAATSTDPAYSGVNAADVSVSNTDNDVANVILVESGGTTAVAEGGATDTYTLVLGSQPTADVVVTLEPSDQLTTAPASVTFTAANWNVAQTVTVSAVNDAVVEGAHDGTVGHTVSSADPEYDGAEVTVVEVSITDNDVAGVTVVESGGTTAVTEGGATDTYTLVLSSQPTANVTVAITPNSQVTTAPTSVVFTTANWNVARTVTVTAVDDVIAEGTHNGDVSHSVTSADAAYNGIGVASIAGTVTDNDVAGITVNPTAGLTTTEAGGTATFTVVLNTQPLADVSIGLSSSDTTEGTVSPTSLTFTAANWNTPRTVTVTGVDDLIVDGNVGYTVITAAATSTDLAYAGVNAADVSVSNTDNDVAGVTVVQSGGNTAVTEGGATDTYTLVLTSQPTADVTVAITPNAQLSRSPASVVFTPANWNVAQTVTVSAVDDAIAEGTHSGNLTHAVTSADTTYNGISVGGITATITDNDVAGITVTPTAGLTTTEAGGTATFTVVLTSQPTADVSIGLSSSDTTEGTVAPTSLTFTSANWNVARTVTVTGVDDLIVDGNVGYTIATAAATSTDPNYAGVNAADVSVTNTDNDVPGATVTPTTGLTTTEAGGTATFTVVLNTQPTADVSIGLSSSDTTEGTVSPTSLTFTSANWNVARTVTVTGVDDVIVDGNIGYTIVTAAATSTDAAYNGVNPADVSVSNTDNDVAGITVTPTAGLTTTEAGGTATFTVVLNTQPSADVSIGLSSSDTTEGTVAPTSLTFTSANWNVARTVTVTGVDDVIVDGNVGYTIVTAAAASSDAAYSGVNAADVSVTNTDNDVAGITVTPTAGLTTTEAGGTATFTVVLNTQPSADVTIGLSSSDTTEGTVAPTSLTFTSANWNTARTMTVTGVDDLIVDGNIGYTIVTAAATSSDAAYNGVNAADVSVSNTDNDVAGITVTPTVGLTTTEAGGTATFTVVLNTQPSADVTIGLSSSDTTEGTVSPTSLTFTPANWNTARTVTVTGIDDLIVDGNVAYTIVTAAATSTDAAYNGVNAADVSVTNTDNDVAGITVNPTAGLTTTEAGGTATFTVVLNTQPTADVTIGLSSSDTTEGTVSPTSLTFTPANWNTARTVTVTGVDDLIVDGNVGYTIVTAAATSTDAAYNGVNPADVSVSNTDNDNPGVTVVQSGGSTNVTEGGATDTYTLVLTSQPTSNVVIALNSGTQLSTAPTSVSFTSANWNVAQTVTVAAVDDAIAEGTHSGSVTHSVTSADPNYQGRLVDSVSATITDNDTAGVLVAESGGNTAATEGGATDTLSVVLQSQPQSTVTVTITPNAQLTVAPSPLTFTSANWNVAQTVTVTAANDVVVEGTHSGTLGFAVASSDPAYGSVTLPGITAAVTDNDAAVVSFASASVSQSEATSPMAFTVTLSNPVASGVTLSVSSSNGTATAGADYTAITAQTVTFAPGSTTAQTVSVAITNDALDEDNETYTLTLSGITATGDVTLGTATATGTIEDDDALPTLSVANVTQAEGNATNTLNFTVNLSPVSGRAVSFTRATVDGTAVSTGPNADFVAIAASTVTIPAGQTSVTIPVTINGDATFEGDESFTLAISAVSNATPGTLSATATLTEDDQQPTTTTIVSDLPDPSVVGQGYPVTVEVRAQTLSPLGTVEVTDGTGASCNAPLTAGTAPLSTMTCTLTSTSAGAKTLTATYTPASTAFGESNDTESHTVNAAATTLVLLGPARARIGTAASYTAELSVTAPGAGTPAGVVTVSSGASSCTITLPTATPSCTITYSTLGSRSVSAVFAPSNGNFSGSTATPVQTLVFASSDVSVTKTNAVNTYRPGDLLVYTVVVRNTGPDAAPQVRVRDVAPAGLTNVAWTCEASGGAICPDAGGIGTLDHVVETLPSNGVLTYAYFGNVIGRPLSIVNVAEVSLPADTTIEDPNLANNSATDTDQLDDLFADGFEAPGINSESGGVRLAAGSLRSTLDDVARVTVRLSDIRGEALRVYARVIGGELQVALAVRGSDGSLRLGSWQWSSGEPELTWTATPGAGGFVLSGASLR